MGAQCIDLSTPITLFSNYFVFVILFNQIKIDLVYLVPRSANYYEAK